MQTVSKNPHNDTFFEFVVDGVDQRYYIQSVLGQGGFALTFHVKRDKEDFVIKKVSGIRQRIMLVAEGYQDAMNINDASLVPVLQLFLHDKNFDCSLYLITEYYPQGDLKAFLQKTTKRLAEDLIWSVLKQMCTRCTAKIISTETFQQTT
jgi:serine/threonine protein kinase